ncbi:hypothetical protein [Breznakiella homolactica]|uniref:NlpC/P60 domain-containing protein n=1 Tax=Breznakiella homolactica TaxID=2798577 RepID=A0A7T7XMZ3_9SPIR|nr:hypothetical protein [Breznakiella homolactica]QQO09281.1 hypothetical protein JFL75_20520 [Breznakiella homolactica]
MLDDVSRTLTYFTEMYPNPGPRSAARIVKNACYYAQLLLEGAGGIPMCNSFARSSLIYAGFPETLDRQTALFYPWNSPGTVCRTVDDIRNIKAGDVVGFYRMNPPPAPLVLSHVMIGTGNCHAIGSNNTWFTIGDIRPGIFNLRYEIDIGAGFFTTRRTNIRFQLRHTEARNLPGA